MGLYYIMTKTIKRAAADVGLILPPNLRRIFN
jgi:hypothetical protein